MAGYAWHTPVSGGVCPAPLSSVRQGVESLGTALQSLPVLEVGVVALGDALGAVEETPAAAGDHRRAVTVT